MFSACSLLFRRLLPGNAVVQTQIERRAVGRVLANLRVVEQEILQAFRIITVAELEFERAALHLGNYREVVGNGGGDFGNVLSRRDRKSTRLNSSHLGS